MIPILGFMNLHNDLSLLLEDYNTSLHLYIHVFWAKIATNIVSSHQNGNLLGKKWRGLIIKLFLIPSPVFRNLAYNLILTLECITPVYTYIHMFFSARTATQNTQLSSIMGTCLATSGECGVEINLCSQLQSSKRYYTT